MTEVKRTRRRKRTIRSGLWTTIECSPCVYHKVCLTSKGHLHFHNHDIADLDAEMIMKALGGSSICKCAQLLAYWRRKSNDKLWYHKEHGDMNIPKSFNGVRPGNKQEILLTRLWRRYRDKHKSIFRKLNKPSSWPKDAKQAISYIEKAFAKYGLSVETESSDDSGKIDSGFVTLSCICNTFKPLSLWLSLYANNTLSIKPVNYNIPSLNLSRCISKSELDFVINRIGTTLFLKEFTDRVYSLLIKSRTDKQIQAAAKHYIDEVSEISGTLSNKVTAITGTDGISKFISLGFAIPYDYVDHIPYLTKQLKQTINLMNKSVENRPPRFEYTNKDLR